MASQSPSHHSHLVRILVALVAVTLSALGSGVPAHAADPAPARAAKTPPGQQVRASRVPLGRASAPKDLPAQAKGRQVRLATTAVTAAVAVVGVTVTRDDPDAQVFVRTLSDGVPGEWTPLALEADGSGAVGSDPYVVTSVDAVEVALMSATTTDTAELQVFASEPTAIDASVAQYAWRDPQIFSRRAWSADESIVRDQYLYGTVTGAMIHHTAGSNSYASGDVPAILRSIQAYHVTGRGWKDIAYNVLVDRFGRSWEGRGGGIDRAVDGGHAYGITNSRVFGVSLMGNYETATPAAAMLDAAERVIAWKFRLFGVDPYGETWGSGGQDGGSTWLPAISGHNDENATACPGKNVDSKMSEIRSKVKGYLASRYTTTGLENFDPGLLMTDESLYAPSALTPQQVADFVAVQGARCFPSPDGTPCLKDFRQNVPTVAATPACSAIGAASGASAAGIVSTVASACGVNPQALLGIVQRQQTLLTSDGRQLSASDYATAAGMTCPAGTTCSPSRSTFFGQVYAAAERLSQARVAPDAAPFRAGTTATVRYSPDTSCSAMQVPIRSTATAALYGLSPYVPNAAALDAVSGKGDACSTYGTRDFYRIMNTWFPGSVWSPTLSAFLTVPTPTISGTARVESPLTAQPGAWSPEATFAYQWYRVSSTGTETAISGATEAGYLPTSTDRGNRLKVRVTGSSAGYRTTSATSALTAAVAYGVFAGTPTPTVSGTAQVGQKLTATPGPWSPAATFTYQWYRVSSDGTSASISGATSSTYTLTSSDRGKRVKVRVSGHRPGYTTVRKYSALTASVAYGVFTTQTTPTITGTVRSGYTLTARPGTWSPAATFSYQWYRVTTSGTSSAISGATASTYKLTSSDRYRFVKVKVTARRSGFTTVSKYSAQTVKVP